MEGTPLFLVGPARSGTTFLQRVLNAHPRILLTNETAVFLQMKYIINSSRIGFSEGIWFGKEYTDLWADIVKSKAKDMIEHYYAHIAHVEEKHGLHFWGDKHPHYCDCLDFITELYPDAVFVMTIRDPRDVALSIKYMTGFPIEKAFSHTSMFFERYGHFFSDHPEYTPFLVFYEHLVAKPRETLEKILKWLHLEFSEEVDKALAQWINRDAHGLEVGLRNFAQNVGKWQVEFSPGEAERAREVLDRYIQLYGYGW